MSTVQNFPSDDDVEVAKIATEKLEQLIDSKVKSLKLIAAGQEVEIPYIALKALLSVLAEISNGNAVKIIPLRKNLTLHEAANLLDVSPQTVTKLRVSKKLRYSQTDSRKTFAYHDVIELKKRLRQDRLEALNELSRVDQESTSTKY